MRILPIILLTSIVLVACASPPSTLPPSPIPTPTPVAGPASSCLPAARRAVELEIHRYQQWLQNESDPAKKAAYQEALRTLQTMQDRLSRLKPADYHPADFFHALLNIAPSSVPPPTPIVLDDAWLDNGDPPQVHFPKQTRSGPFYIVTGAAVKTLPLPEKHFRLTLQPVLPQSYPFPSLYVCITAVRER